MTQNKESITYGSMPTIKAGVMKIGRYNDCMVIPVQIAKAYGITKGNKLTLELADNGIFIRKAKLHNSGSVSQ